MRRSDREITDDKTINQFIDRENIIHIAFYDDGDIYVVPVNYGHCLQEGKHVFYFHGAKAGRKYELALKTPSVGFEIDGVFEVLPADIACDYSAKFQSVIGTGKLSVIEEVTEKVKGLNILMKQISGKESWEYKPQMIEGVAVYKLEVTKMSCKAK